MNLIPPLSYMLLLLTAVNSEELIPGKPIKKTTKAASSTTKKAVDQAGQIGDLPPNCVSTNGEDLTSCEVPGATCLGSSFNRGCNQQGLDSPVCVTNGCNQDGSHNPTCTGGSCSQRGVTGDQVSCTWGCDQSDYKGSGTPSCSGGNCCWTGPGAYEGFCAGAPKNSNVDWGCNSNSKSCRRGIESEDDVEVQASFLRTN